MAVEQSTWDFLQKHLGYNDEEMELFKANPRNELVIEKMPELAKKTMVFEVVESHGCASGHKKGDRFVMDMAGNLLSKQCPGRMCMFALYALTPGVFAATELLYAGKDPNDMLFKDVGCFDVGVKCGGWGHINMRLKVEDRG